MAQHPLPHPPVPYVVRMGRRDGKVKKVCFLPSKKLALEVANSIAFLLWERHPFKPSQCNNLARSEEGEYWVEVKPA